MRNFWKVMLVTTLLALTACANDGDNRHTTATTVVPPPARQVLKVETRPSPKTPFDPKRTKGAADPSKPLLLFGMPNGSTFSEGDAVVIDFSLANAKLKGDGGEFRVRYIVDDEEMRWIDRWEAVWLTGWLPGKHTIRLELVGPDGWPYKNGDHNVVTREIMVGT